MMTSSLSEVENWPKVTKLSIKLNLNSENVLKTTDRFIALAINNEVSEPNNNDTEDEKAGIKDVILPKKRVRILINYHNPNSDYEYYVKPEEERPVKIGIKGLPRDTNVGIVDEGLRELGFKLT
ncbi:hypothetical protein NPIL_549001 [Nephila pilipes]|uniref:Uncharacterized protein n=1 Tax=Nephila pilipes TaxID=299642 RepID=A0A8X6NVM8_NEPPI|nr:hypothetical protein NPIL_549001 [Nephila pilipes]